MGELGDYWRDHHAEMRARRLAYQEKELKGHLALLSRLDGVQKVAEHNKGEHFVLSVPSDHGPKEVDYYPSTGLWKLRNGRAAGHGIPKLQRYFKLKEREDEQRPTANP